MAQKPKARSPKKKSAKAKKEERTQRERFRETARAIGVDETGKEFERLFSMVVAK
ncbi:MAG: hypothetical protein AB7R87_10295 [Parvibaculaceae bacterium]